MFVLDRSHHANRLFFRVCHHCGKSQFSVSACDYNPQDVQLNRDQAINAKESSSTAAFPFRWIATFQHKASATIRAYEDFIGLTEVKEAQGKVLQVSLTDFQKAEPLTADGTEE